MLSPAQRGEVLKTLNDMLSVLHPAEDGSYEFNMFSDLVTEWTDSVTDMKGATPGR